MKLTALGDGDLVPASINSAAIGQDAAPGDRTFAVAYGIAESCGSAFAAPHAQAVGVHFHVAKGKERCGRTGCCEGPPLSASARKQAALPEPKAHEAIVHARLQKCDMLALRTRCDQRDEPNRDAMGRAARV